MKKISGAMMQHERGESKRTEAAEEAAITKTTPRMKAQTVSRSIPAQGGRRKISGYKAPKKG